MSKKRRIFISALIIGCIVAALTLLTLAAYFAKGVFKDVFVNKEDYFSADLLYGISSLDASKPEVGSSGMRREINIYNNDLSTGDFNSFDITFDVYAWLDSALPDGEYYTVYDGSGGSVSLTSTEHTEPIFRNLKLPGGQISSVTLAVEFHYAEGEDLSLAPGLHIVAVPTVPQRMSSSYLGAVIKPNWSDAFAVNCDFDHTGLVKDYAAFTYRVTTVGNAQPGDKLEIKWKSDTFVLIHMNGEEPNITPVQEGDFGNGFDRKIEWNVQSNHTDTFVFFRNNKNDMWQTDDQDWDLLREQISTQHLKSSS